jgi:hypothetical protein
MNSNLELVSALAARFPAPSGGGIWMLRGVSDVKLRTFTSPGETLQIEASVAELLTNAATVKVETRKGNRIIGGSRVRLVPQRCS